MIFTYKARNEAGELVTGETDAKDAIAVKYALAEQGLFPTFVAKKGLTIDLKSIFRRRKKARTRDLLAMTRQFYALFRAGVNMDRLLATLAKQAPDEQLKAALEQIRRDVSSGTSLAGAFAKHPQYFNELYINMLSVGEQTGVLEQALVKLVQVLEKEHKLIANIKSATLYPKIVIFVFICVVTLMLVYVIPRFADFYAGFDAKLPLPTRILIGASNFVAAYWYIPLIGGVALYIAYRKFAVTEKGRFLFDRIRYMTPVFGNLNMLVANARFGHLVAAMYKSGIQLSKTLEIVGRAIGNRCFEKEVQKVNDEVSKGSSLATAMENKKLFAGLLVESVAVGEQTGSLDDMMENTAQFFDEEIDSILDQLTTLIEPLLLVGIFGMVGLLALAIFLPWWNITRLVLQGSGG